MKKFSLLCLAAVFSLTTWANGQGCPHLPDNDTCFFYGGDLNLNDPNQNGLSNENDAIVGGNPYGAATYQNFLAGPGSTWVNDLFTNNLSQLTPDSGYWEIRKGISEGNGGTLIASGTASGDNWWHAPTGRNDFGYTEYTDAAMNVDVSLAEAGTYWFAVVPICTTCAGRSFNSDTDGLNSVGQQITGQQYFNSAFFGANFTNANNEGMFNIFSSGVANWIPEPSSFVLLGSGVLAVATAVRRQVSRRVRKDRS